MSATLDSGDFYLKQESKKLGFDHTGLYRLTKRLFIVSVNQACSP